MPNFEIKKTPTEKPEDFHPTKEDTNALLKEGEKPTEKSLPRKKVAKLAEKFVEELENKGAQPEFFKELKK